MIGSQAAGYSGLDVLSADLSQLELRSQWRGTMSPGGFYREAIQAWSMITPRLTGGPGRLGNDLVFHNPQITDEAGLPLTPIPWMARRGLYRTGQVRGLSGVGLRREQWDQLVELRRRIPDLPLADETHYVLSAPAGEKTMAQLPYKELYLTFRAKVENPRHFEEKWVEALGVDIGVEWRGIWGGSWLDPQSCANTLSNMCFSQNVFAWWAKS